MYYINSFVKHLPFIVRNLLETSELDSDLVSKDVSHFYCHSMKNEIRLLLLGEQLQPPPKGVKCEGREGKRHTHTQRMRGKA